ncbi:hypothetical protein NQ314_011375 [Rhamnusium bicolor]|uniref:DDE-1 domain-containing protein n=1 Tax=Rhamnusium bicolor TaxID=1586634 RepID=A0AAV8XJH4_9CUCU|nr:hypothetical protein NQ314_011375 [Rhamnusium bicolor]
MLFILQRTKVLLFLDGHTTHCKNLEALLLARESGVILMQLPGHTTHRLQPLNKSFFKPMEVYYTQASEKWLRSNAGRVVTQYQVAELLNEAYGRAATIQTAANGLKVSGVWPVNRHVFKDSDFIGSTTLILKNTQTKPLTLMVVTLRLVRSLVKMTTFPYQGLIRPTVSVPQGCSIPLVVLKPRTDLDEALPSKSSLFSISLEEIASLPTLSDNIPSEKEPEVSKDNGPAFPTKKLLKSAKKRRKTKSEGALKRFWKIHHHQASIKSHHYQASIKSHHHQASIKSHHYETNINSYHYQASINGHHL